MTRTPLLLLLLLSMPALAQDTSGTVRRIDEVQALTRNAPLVSCLDPSSPTGMDLRSVRGFRIGLEAPAGQTLTGGMLRAWYYDFTRATWGRTPQLDRTVTPGFTLLWFPDQSTIIRSGCLLYAADGVTLSGGGSTVTVRHVAWTGGA